MPITFDPLIDPLQLRIRLSESGNTPDILLHTVCAGLLHLLCDVTINLHCKCRRSVAEIFLERFDIVPRFQAIHSISVPLRYNNDKPEDSRIFKGFQRFQPDF